MTSPPVLAARGPVKERDNRARASACRVHTIHTSEIGEKSV